MYVVHLARLVLALVLALVGLANTTIKNIQRKLDLKRDWHLA